MDPLWLVSTVAIAVLSTIVTQSLFHFVTAAKFHWSQDIRVRAATFGPLPYTYSVRLRRVGGVFDLVDIKVTCALVIQGIAQHRPQNYTTYSLYTTSEYSPTLSTRRLVFYVRPHRSPAILESNRLIDLVPGLPAPGAADLGRLLRVGTSAYLQFTAIGVDRFSGVTRVHISPRYRAFNLREGSWDKFGLILDTPPVA